MIVETHGDVIALSGPLTQNHWMTLKAACHLVLNKHPEGMIIDCGGLTDCTPHGAHTFRDAINYIQSCQARIILANMPPRVLDVVKSVPDVRSCIAVANSMEEARASLELGCWMKAPQHHNGPIVMLPVVSTEEALASVGQASRVAHEKKGQLVLVSVLEVPRSMAKSAPMPEQEAEIQAMLDFVDGQARKSGLHPQRYIERTREFSQGLIDAVRHLKADVIVFGIPAQEQPEPRYEQIAELLLKRAPCEVIISKLSIPRNGHH